MIHPWETGGGGERGAGFTKRQGKKVRANASENLYGDIQNSLSLRGIPSAPRATSKDGPRICQESKPPANTLSCKPLCKISPGGAAPKFCRCCCFSSPSPGRGDAAFCWEFCSLLQLRVVCPCVWKKLLPILPPRSSPPFAKQPPQQQQQPRTLAPVCLLCKDPKPLNFLHFQLHLHGNHRLSSNPPHPP